jgi:hypothetical protein
LLPCLNYGQSLGIDVSGSGQPDGIFYLAGVGQLIYELSDMVGHKLRCTGMVLFGVGALAVRWHPTFKPWWCCASSRAWA